MHLRPFQGPSVMGPTLLTPTIGILNCAANSRYASRQSFPYGSCWLSWSESTAQADGDSSSLAPILPSDRPMSNELGKLSAQMFRPILPKTVSATSTL